MVRSSLRALSLAVAVAALAACSNDMVSAPGPVASYTLAGVPLPSTGDPAYRELQPNTLKVCTFDGPSDVTNTAAPGGLGAANLETSTTLVGTYHCSIVFIHPGGGTVYTLSATRTGPAGTFLRRTFLGHTTGSTNLTNDGSEDGNCEGPANIGGTVQTTLAAGQGAVIWFKVCVGDAPPPPPPGDCNGLTPGFWKNYDNHYTEEEFADLLDGTSFFAISNSTAKAYLQGNNPALVRLRKFLLANELTISLALNPDLDQKGGLTGDCLLTIDGVEYQLADAITLAKAILAVNGVGFTNQAILDAGTILDKFANL